MILLKARHSLAVIKGGGDLATGVAYRLFRCGFNIIMTEKSRPLVVRRTVALAEAVFSGQTEVGGIKAQRADNARQALSLAQAGSVAVIVDPRAAIIKQLQPLVVVDATMAKRNIGTSGLDAPLVIGLGPGFTAGHDVHAVIETCRGHNLGCVIYQGRAKHRQSRCDTGVYQRTSAAGPGLRCFVAGPDHWYPGKLRRFGGLCRFAASRSPYGRSFTRLS